MVLSGFIVVQIVITMKNSPATLRGKLTYMSFFCHQKRHPIQGPVAKITEFHDQGNSQNCRASLYVPRVAVLEWIRVNKLLI